MRIVLDIQSRWRSLNAAQRQMTHRIEADRALSLGIVDGKSHLCEAEDLPQTEHLHILLTAVLLQSCFEQTRQLGEALMQMPAGERSG